MSNQLLKNIIEKTNEYRDFFLDPSFMKSSFISKKNICASYINTITQREYENTLSYKENERNPNLIDVTIKFDLHYDNKIPEQTLITNRDILNEVESIIKLINIYFNDSMLSNNFLTKLKGSIYFVYEYDLTTNIIKKNKFYISFATDKINEAWAKRKGKECPQYFEIHFNNDNIEFSEYKELAGYYSNLLGDIPTGQKLDTYQYEKAKELINSVLLDMIKI